MSEQRARSGLVNIFFGEEMFDFRLRIGELIELQEKRQLGPMAILTRFQTGMWFVEDITDTIRLGLIGGGMSKEEAFKLTSRHVKDGYLIDCAPIAAAVLIGALSGVDGDEVGEAEAASPMTEAMAEDLFSGLTTSDSGEPLDSHQIR